MDHVAVAVAYGSRAPCPTLSRFSGDGCRGRVELIELAAREALTGFRIIEHRVGESGRDRADLVEARNLLGRQRHLGRGEAGLTHGALYAHFPSKEALAAAAFSHGFSGNMARTRAWAGDRRPSFDEHLDGLLSTHMRDNIETGCPMAASASEIARQGCAVSASFTHAFEELAGMIEASLDDAIPAPERRRLAVAAVVAEIGAIAVSRAVAKTDAKLSDEVLRAVRETVGAAYKVEVAGTGSAN